MPKSAPIEERFWPKVDKRAPNQCWPWLGAHHKAGPPHYGVGFIARGGGEKRFWVAPRVAWELTNGPIPDGLCVLHICDNRACVNPAHLWLGSRGDNSRDMWGKGRAKVAGQPPIYGDSQVAAMKVLKAAGFTQQAISDITGASQQQISRLLRGFRSEHRRN